MADDIYTDENGFDVIQSPDYAPSSAPVTLEQSVAKQIKMSVDPDIAASVRKNVIKDEAKQSIIRGSMRNPDEFARYVRLHDKTGYDPELLASDPEVRAMAEQEHKVGSIDFDRLKESAPNTLMFVSDPVNGAVAHDDIKPLSDIEHSYNMTSAFLRETVAGLTSSTATGTYGTLAMGFGLARKYYSEPAIAFLKEHNIEPGGNIPYIDIFGMGEEYYLKLQKESEQAGKLISGRTGNEGLVEGSVRSAGYSFGSMSSDILMAGKTAATAPAKIKSVLDLMTMKVAGQEYGEAKEAGLDSTNAAAYAAAQATVERVMETMPVKYLLGDDIFKKSLVKSVVNYQLKEGGTEQLTTVLQDFNKWAMIEENQGKTINQYLQERPNAALATAISTTLAGGAQVSTMAAVNWKLNSKNLTASKAFFDALHNGVKESKLHSRLPEKTKEFITKLKDSGEIKDVFISAESFKKFFQSQESDPDKAATELLGEDGPKILQEAFELGGDLVIPLETYAEKVAGTEIHEGLANDLRLRQGDISRNEAELELKNLSIEEREIAKSLADSQKQTAEDASLAKIYDDVKRSAITVGVPASKADVWATIETERYRKRAYLRNMDPWELYNETGAIQIAREGMPVPEGGMQYDQISGNQVDTPEFKTWFTDSKVVDAEGKPMVVYHGTSKDFSEFKESSIGKSSGNRGFLGAGFYMTGDTGVASAYASEAGGNVMPVYVSLTNPLRIDQSLSNEAADAINKALDIDVFSGGMPINSVRDGLISAVTDNPEVADQLTSGLQSQGNDGVIFGDMREVVVFSPTQIKSAIGNRGTFDPKNANILYQKERGMVQISGNQIDTPEFKTWFTDSKVVDTEGKPMVVYTGTSKDVDFSAFKIPKNGAWFTSDPKVASSYAVDNDSKRLKTDDYRTFREVNTASRVMPVYLSIKNPYTLTESESKELFKASNYKRVQGQIFEKAKAQGYDGVDFGDGNWVVIGSPTQIKSAIGNRGTFDPKNANILYQSAPTFYSQLSRAISQAKQESMPAGQWKLWLQSNAGKLQVKKDEIQWSGITDWLDLQQGKVSKADVLAYLDGNGVRVQDVMLGDNSDVEAWWNDEDGANEETPFGDLTPDEQRDAGRRYQEEVGKYEEGGAKYSQYTVPGGENYKELLLTLPENKPIATEKESRRQELEGKNNRAEITNAEFRELLELRKTTPRADERANFRSSHFDVPNILAHVRFDERTDADGNRVLFIQEVQSDWQQSGRKHGVKKSDSRTWNEIDSEISAVTRERSRLLDEAAALPDSEMAKFRRLTGEIDRINKQLTELQAEQDAINTNRNAVPDAPFVGTADPKPFVALALKRMITYAAENGFDKVAFITGQQAADLYDLSKQVELVRAAPLGGGKYNIAAFKTKGETPIIKEDGIDIDRVADIVGKDLADKIQKAQIGKVSDFSGLDLKVGGEGMRAFYDQIVPQVAGDVLKKVGGGKVESIKIEQRLDVSEPERTQYGWTVQVNGKPFTIEGSYPRKHARQAAIERYRKVNSDIAFSGDSLGFTITPELRAKVRAEGLPLFQKERGMVQIAEGYRRITLLAEEDPSTFIHELGHTWLEELKYDASLEGAHPDLVEDWKTISEWLDIAGEESIPVKAHEKFARGTEAYFMEGNAPSQALRKVMYKVKQWMISVYKSLTGLNVNLNDDVRAVFDRLIAFDEEIDKARAANGFVQMFSTPDQAGMTEGEFVAYMRATEEARKEAQEKMVADVAKELKKEKTQEWADNWKATRLVEQAKAEELPIYRALAALTVGEEVDGSLSKPIKLSKQAIIDMAGEGAIESLKPGGARKGKVYATRGGLHPDLVAKMFNMDDGQILIKALAEAEPIDEYIDGQTKRVMNERFGDPLDPGTLSEQAEQIVHSDKQADLLSTELKILRRAKNAAQKTAAPIRAEQRQKTAEAKRELDAAIPMALLQEAAYAQISEMKSGEIRRDHFFYAEIRWGKKAQQAAASGDFTAAADAKQKQILNFYLYREASKAVAETNKVLKKAQRLGRDSAQRRIGKAGQEWLDQLNDVLDRFSLITLKKTNKARSMVEWAEHVRETTGEELALSEDVLNDARRVNFKELTMNELRAVYDSLISIEHVASKLNKVYRNGVEYEEEQTVAELVNSVNKMAEKPMPNLDKDLSMAASVAKMTKGFFNSTLRPEKIIERLDGGKSGVWHDLFWNRAVDAQNLRDDLRVMVMKPIVEITEKLTPEQKSSMNSTITIKSLDGKKISRRQMIGIAFNVGNQSNLQKLKEGGIWFGQKFYTLDDVVLTEILDNMQEWEWTMVQSVGDTIEKLYPYLNELNKRAVGVPLEKVEVSPVNTKFGKFRGWYWPAVADSRHSKVGEHQENSERMITGLFAPMYPKAATTHSFREERTKAAYPLQFDWERVLSNHVGKAITDIAYHEWIKQSRRLLEKSAVKKSIQNTMGEEVYRAMEEWLVHQVIPIQGGYSANQPVDNLSTSLLSNTVVAALGFKASTAIANMVVAPFQAMHQIRADYLVLGLSKFLADPKKSLYAVHQMSGEMRHRFEHYEQTFNITLSSLEGKSTLRAGIARFGMMVHLYADRITSTALWIAGYEQSINKGMSIDEAKRFADKAIRTTQTAGAPKDLSSFERDPRYRIFKMFIGPMIIMQNEMRGAVAGKGAKALISPEVWTAMFATWIIPAVLFEIAVGRGPEDDEEWWEWALRKIALYPALTMPFIRDAATAVEAAITGKEGQIRSNPVTDAAVQIVRSTNKALSEDAEVEDWMNAILRTSGVLIGIPANQISISKDFMLDLYDGEVEGVEDLRYLIYRKPEEE